MIHDMTSGNPIKLILLFAFPLFIGNIFQQLYSISDIIIVGRLLGVTSLAAVGAMTPVFMMMVMILAGFTTGLSIITAQRFGAKDTRGVRKSFATGLILSTVFGFIITFTMIIEMGPILVKMQVPEEILIESEQFIRVLSYAVMATVFYNYFSNIMRALGDSKTPLYFLIFACVLNIALNIFFIVFKKYGVAGSAFGTGIAQAVSALLCLCYMLWRFPILRLHKTDFRITWTHVVDHLKIAFPMAMQFSIIGLGILLIQRVCNSFGPEVIAAFASAARVEQIATLPMVSIGVAMATYTAQNFGAKKMYRISQGVLQCSLFSFLISIVMAIIIHTWGKQIVSIFLDEPNPAVLDAARTYLEITTLFYCFLGQIFVFRLTLQGMGYALLPFLACVLETVMRGFAALYLATKWGYIGICYASPIAWIAGMLVVAIGYFWVMRHYKTPLFDQSEKNFFKKIKTVFSHHQLEFQTNENKKTGK